MPLCRKRLAVPTSRYLVWRRMGTTLDITLEIRLLLRTSKGPKRKLARGPVAAGRYANAGAARAQPGHSYRSRTSIGDFPRDVSGRIATVAWPRWHPNSARLSD